MAVVVAAVAVWLLAWFFTPRLARHKGRRPGEWTLAVILLGPVSLLLLAVLPRRSAAV